MAATLKPDPPPFPLPYGYTGIAGGFTGLGQDGIVVSVTPDALNFLNITAHEVGHALTLTHDGREKNHLMIFSADWNNNAKDPKRFNDSDFDTMKTNGTISGLYVPIQ